MERSSDSDRLAGYPEVKLLTRAQKTGEQVERTNKQREVWAKFLSISKNTFLGIFILVFHYLSLLTCDHIHDVSRPDCFEEGNSKSADISH